VTAGGDQPSTAPGTPSVGTDQPETASVVSDLGDAAGEGDLAPDAVETEEG